MGVTVPICAMKGGVDLQKYIDLLVPGNAKIKIIHGEGPINLIGSHCVDYFGFKDDEEDSEDEEKGKKASPAKSPSTNKKSTPEKGDTEKKVTPSKEDSKKRKTSSETKSAEKKAKN